MKFYKIIIYWFEVARLNEFIRAGKFGTIHDTPEDLTFALQLLENNLVL